MSRRNAFVLSGSVINTARSSGRDLLRAWPAPRRLLFSMIRNGYSLFRTLSFTGQKYTRKYCMIFKSEPTVNSVESIKVNIILFASYPLLAY